MRSESFRSRDRTRVGVLATLPQRVTELIALAEGIRPKLDVDFIFLETRAVHQKFGRLVSEKGFDQVLLRELLPARQVRESPAGPPNKSTARRVRSRLERLMRGSFCSHLLVSFVIQGLLSVQSRLFQRMVRRESIRALIACGDRHLGVEPSALKAASRCGIPVLIPHMSYSDPAGAIHLRALQGERYKPGPRMQAALRRRIPVWPTQAKAGYLFYEACILLALNRFGALSRDPWHLGCGLSTVLCVDNERTLRRYIDSGVNERKLELTGDTAYDTIHNSFKRKSEILRGIQQAHDLQAGQPIVIIALPQLAEHGLLDWSSHHVEIEYLLGSLDLLPAEILVSLHPKMEREHYVPYERNHRCRILKERLSVVLPIADLFCATYSSTVIWSVFCGISTLVFDFYGFNYTAFDDLQSVRVVTRREEFLPAAQSGIAKKPDFRNDWASLGREIVFDGRCGRRYAQAIDHLVKGR